MDDRSYELIMHGNLSLVHQVFKKNMWGIYNNVCGSILSLDVRPNGIESFQFEEVNAILFW